MISQINKVIKQMRMIDIHAHLSYTKKTDGEEKEELDFRRAKGIVTCFSTGTPEEWTKLVPWMKRAEILNSFGIHPWYADRYLPEQCREYLESCDFIGEIGMDSVWCQVPLKIQKRVFEKQLQVAADLGKPVLLHTKGQERAIREVIQDFPGKICVHWYSGTERDLDGYLEKDCYFTLGPDLAENKSEEKQAVYSRILTEVPAERLFVETDGISAVAWARDVETLDITEIPIVLQKNMEYAAKWKKMSGAEMERQMKDNLMRFLG